MMDSLVIPFLSDHLIPPKRVPHLRKEPACSPLSMEKCQELLKLMDDNEKWIKSLACS